MKELATNYLNSSPFTKSICDFAIKTKKVIAVDYEISLKTDVL